MDNLEGARTLLTVEKKFGKVLRFSIIDDFSKKKFSKKKIFGQRIPETPQKGVNILLVYFSRKRPYNHFKTKMG